MQDVLSDSIREAMNGALFDKLEDGTFAGRTPECPGVVASGPALRSCEEDLRSTLEDWVLVGLKLGHRLPVHSGIDLNQEPRCEPVDAK